MRTHSILSLAALTILACTHFGCAEEEEVTTPPVQDETTSLYDETEEATNEYTPASAREEENEMEGDVVGGSVGAGAETTGEAAQSPDATIVATLIAIDENEIAAATEAQQKQVSQPVMDYANMLHQAHTQHKQQTTDLAQQIQVQPVNSPDVNPIRSKGAQTLSSIANLQGTEFERAFVDAMVQGHTDALAEIDSALEKVTDEQLRQHLTETRTAIEEHLRRGQELKGQLGG